MGPPHSLHETIREGKTTGFSHWGQHVIFSLPPDVKNGPETIATLRYNVRPRGLGDLRAGSFERTARLALCTPIGRSGRSAHTPMENDRNAVAVTSALPDIARALLCRPDRLLRCTSPPASTPWRRAGRCQPRRSFAGRRLLEWAASNEPYLGYLLLTLAGFGAASTWLVGSIAPHQPIGGIGRTDAAARPFWCGFPIAASAFIFCISAMWAGIAQTGRPNHRQYRRSDSVFGRSGLSGLRPSIRRRTASGTSTRCGVRWRPRSDPFFWFLATFRCPPMLILQACMVAAAACFATYAVAMWRGVSGLESGFSALTYIYARYFVPTTLTEAAGIVLGTAVHPALSSTPSVRGSVRPALIAFAMTTVALMTTNGQHVHDSGSAAFGWFGNSDRVRQS